MDTMNLLSKIINCAEISAALHSHCSARSLVICCSLAGIGVTSAMAGPPAAQPALSRENGLDHQHEHPRANGREQQGSDESHVIESSSFDAYAEDHRDHMQQEESSHYADSFRRNGGLTDDQRRDLRRQIDEAAQNLYPKPLQR
jgi:hypothetical protein